MLCLCCLQVRVRLRLAFLCGIPCVTKKLLSTPYVISSCYYTVRKYTDSVVRFFAHTPPYTGYDHYPGLGA